jgi:hypothetical protein
LYAIDIQKRERGRERERERGRGKERETETHKEGKKEREREREREGERKRESLLGLEMKQFFVLNMHALPPSFLLFSLSLSLFLSLKHTRTNLKEQRLSKV